MTAFTLDLVTDPTRGVAKLRLRDRHGDQVAAHQVRLGDHSPALFEGLFDARGYLQRYGDARRSPDGRARSPEELLDDLGAFLGEHVLGPGIAAALAKGMTHRTLLVRLPETADDLLAAGFARVPWEIARPAAGEESLADRGVVVRAITAATAAERVAGEPLPVKPDEPLRVLLVYAAAPGSRPLAMRLEREALRRVFRDEVMHRADVQLDVLCHGVTKDALTRTVREARGYHVVHWSGHGHRDQLELTGPDGRQARISGAALVKLFRDAGGYFPRLVFLSACHSGALVGPGERAALRALWGEDDTRAAAETEPQGSPETLRHVLENPAGYTGTALGLLRAGVRQVIAMRYAVGDRYARHLAGRFYHYLLGVSGRYPADEALGQARNEVCQQSEELGPFSAADPCTPLLFGEATEALEPAPRRSAQLERWRPHPWPLLPGGTRDLEPRARFVGRGRELSRLAEAWLEADARPVALVQGLAGLGKTALAAEAIHLWHPRFAAVLAFQFRGHAVTAAGFCRQLDQRLVSASKVYRGRVERDPLYAVDLPPEGPLEGDARRQRMRDNAVAALTDEKLLVVLDNFETNLEDIPEGGLYACADPEWTALLEALAQGLVRSGSRLLVTSRHRPAALVGDEVEWLPLGPLPELEARLYLEGHETLRKLATGDEADQLLARRVLESSRGHPLLLQLLGDLAGDRPALEAALERIEQQGYAGLPELFAARRVGGAEREAEQAWLEDALVGAVDLLLERLSPPARRLAWLLTRALEPVPAELTEVVWEEAGSGEPFAWQLTALVNAGLVTPDGEGESVAIAFHEVVRERAAARMQTHEEERGGREEADVWRVYGGWYAARFKTLEQGNLAAALEPGRRALTYFARARNFDGLGELASGVVNSTRDPSALAAIIGELRAIAEEVPTGRDRWVLRTNLADALSGAGRSDRALALYEQAAEEAETAEDWLDFSVVCQNWANALRAVGQLERARATYERSAEADRREGRPAIYAVGSELAALRIEVIRGEANEALPKIEARLERVHEWWARHLRDEPVPEAPEPVILCRLLLSGLDIAAQAYHALEDWQACLERLDEIAEVKGQQGASDHEMGRTTFNRCTPLRRLGRFAEARQELEGCLEDFRRAGDVAREAMALSALASVWDKLGDTHKAAELERQALAVRNRRPDPAQRATSHNNLGNYLERTGDTDGQRRHALAAIAYRLVTGHHQAMRAAIRGLASRIQRAKAAGERYELPRLTDLLADPAFGPLARFLSERQVDLAELQREIDDLEGQARSDAT